MGDAVIYQVYPRSFQDSDGDGIGDLPGIRARLAHVASLGADAVWLSPVYPSPMADSGYDVSDYVGIDPSYGSLADFDALLGEAHRLGLRLLMDLVPCHTSIEHPWFREHPDWYIQVEGDRPPNNWRATFGGPAWSRDERSGRWYLHSFYPEQPDLDWRNPELVAAMRDVVRFWLDRGVDGFRVDAVDRLLKDRRLRDDPVAETPFALPLEGEYAALEHRYSAMSPTSRRAWPSCALPRATGCWWGRPSCPPGRSRAICATSTSCSASSCCSRRLQAEALRRADRARARAGPVGLGAVQPRLRTRGDALRPRPRARRGAAAADPAGRRLRLSGRGDRHAGGSRRRSPR